MSQALEYFGREQYGGTEVPQTRTATLCLRNLLGNFPELILCKPFSFTLLVS